MHVRRTGLLSVDVGDDDGLRPSGDVENSGRPAYSITSRYDKPRAMLRPSSTAMPLMVTRALSSGTPGAGRMSRPETIPKAAELTPMQSVSVRMMTRARYLGAALTRALSSAPMLRTTTSWVLPLGDWNARIVPSRATS